ncbi:ABC transporter ATP-binding protein [Paludibacter jiangxiensis]|uniref:Iron complex transport system ATP-binding protein n=1 Tax=Paludibacter jiangxiensis TaxID=681398 RepID=A0A161L984_9BACT|nr:ABC transporter ATP-binding protein [Paludibacter jiangxiensis]GAT63974.1 iron complex transport system ATP-binding protein [Paludibacter jiangxiensis]
MEEIKNPLLQIDALCGGYKSFNLQQIGFTLDKGDFAGIIGPNGSGKSTLVKMLLGDLKRSSGSMLLEGKELSAMPVRQKAQTIAVVTQHIEDTSMSVLEYVLLGRLPYRELFQFFEKREDVAKAEKYMELTGILKYRDQPLSSLSGGERQLAAMARALTQEPKLLLLDEPTSQLDISHQVQVLDLVRELNCELGLTVLMIIHDLNLASSYCNKLLLLNGGKLHTQGMPDEVLQFSIIEEVYRTVVVTRPNPVTGRPTVFLVPRHQIEKLKKERE